MSDTLKLKTTLEIQKTVEVEFRKNGNGVWDWIAGNEGSSSYFDSLEKAFEDARKYA